MLGDAAVGLLGGLFIAAIDTMVERVVASIPNPERDFPPFSAGCRLGAQIQTGMVSPTIPAQDGRLPFARAFFRYFSRAPLEIDVKVGIVKRLDEGSRFNL